MSAHGVVAAGVIEVLMKLKDVQPGIKAAAFFQGFSIVLLISLMINLGSESNAMMIALAGLSIFTQMLSVGLVFVCITDPAVRRLNLPRTL